MEWFRNLKSPYRGAYPGRWPIRVNPDDVRFVYFQNPEDHAWHRLTWEHAALLETAFSAEAARYARVLAAREGRFADRERALAGVLARWSEGVVADRRERRMAARLSAERAAIPAQPGTVFEGPEVSLPVAVSEPAPLLGDDDGEDELVEDAEGYYDDALEVLR